MLPKPLPTGRPSHIYRMPPKDFLAYWSATEKHTTHEKVIEPGFGAQGYELLKGVHQFRITLIPTDVSNAFYWVRLETPDAKVNFSMPSVTAAEDLPKLLESWEVNDMRWVVGNGLLASPSFPEAWSTPPEYASSKERFDMLVADKVNLKFGILTRAGVHAVRTPAQYLAGVMGVNTMWEVVQHFRRRAPSDVPFPKPGETALHAKLVHELRFVSAKYTREKLLTVGEGYVLPYVPHHELLGIPATSMTPFTP